jgi:hypothetical protein
MDKQTLLKRIRFLTWFFIIATVMSGVTAFPLEWEVKLLARMVVPFAHAVPFPGNALMHWVLVVRNGLVYTNAHYPFIAYGTDWLAFGHIVIATAFVGVLRDPVRNKWIVEWAMIACVLVIPLAMICGPIRGIPFYWRLIDCSFGVFGIIPLWIVRGYILRLEKVP